MGLLWTKASEMAGLLRICSGVALLLFTTGCSSDLYNWTVRTTSSPIAPTSDLVILGQHPIAVFTSLSPSGLRGNEAGLAEHLVAIIKRVSPRWNVLDMSQTVSLINEHGLAGDYVRLRADAEQSHVLDRDILQKLSAALGARLVFLPRLAYFMQDYETRWTVPAANFRVVQTTYSILRMSLTLWDASNGALLWSSVAEASLQSEKVSRNPVFFEDAARIALGSMISDLINKKTSSNYTPYNEFVNQLMREGIPQIETKPQHAE